MTLRWIAIGLALAGLGLKAQTPAAPQARPPIDLTGYWVSLVTEDWRYRMLNAPKGDYYSIPLNAEGKRVADTWDAAKDIAEGKQCMSYGAPNIMREPARLHIAWVNDRVNDAALKVEIDAGKQTRLFLFGATAPSGEPALQGISIAQWQTPQSIRAATSKISAQDPNTPGFAAASMASPPPPPDTRRLGRNLEGGNHSHQARVSAQQRSAVQRERGTHGVLRPSQDQWRRVSGPDASLEDPRYLNAPWVVSNHYRREPDGSKWDPQPCELVLPSK